jgi:predicted Rossmann fold flavoprotein
MNAGLKVLIVEKTNQLLTKVKVSGGGRCNVTHHCFNAIKLAHHYPRGEKQLKALFKQYQAEDLVTWFDSKGVALKTESDGRMFPATDHSQTIIDCFLREALRLKIKIEAGLPVSSILPQEHGFMVNAGSKSFTAKAVLIACGGNAKKEAYQFIADLGHTIVSPIPSLFTFNDAQKDFKDLMGLSVANASVRIAGTKFTAQGPVLITHWGLSGPAVIRLSAWSAEYLHQQNYRFTAMVNWTGDITEDALRAYFHQHKQSRGKQKVVSNNLFEIPQRLWQRLCSLAGINDRHVWSELPQKNLNRLIEFLIRCPFTIAGKTTFKEEFVTCGGVDLSDIDITTMQSRKVKNLYFAGEVLNIDGETGGFNFQAAWTTAYVAARSMHFEASHEEAP